jgi:hypothetical protein
MPRTKLTRRVTMGCGMPPSTVTPAGLSMVSQFPPKGAAIVPDPE